MWIYNMFYASLLTRDPADLLLEQKYLELLLVKIENGEEWKTEEIVNVKRVDRALKACVR
jgi:hypothetical protein